VHETAEEEVIYPVVRSAELGGDDIADDRLQEQSNAKNMLSDLERIGVDSDEHAPRFAALRDAVVRHTESEEHTVLPLDRVGQAVRAAESLAPTHPTPTDPTVLSATWRSGQWRQS
jgi:hypothetical protein